MKEKQQVLMPSYIKDFKCIGSDCKLSCCSYGWNITVDNNTYLKYKSIKDPKLSNLIKKYIVKKNLMKGKNAYVYSIKHIYSNENISIKTLDDDGNIIEEKIEFKNVNCPFETEERLCGLQRELGYNYLCDVCKIFPRLYNNVYSFYECGMNSGCEVVCELLYNIKEGISLEIVETEVPNQRYLNINKKLEDYTMEYIDSIRMTCFQILQFKEQPLDNRMILLSIFLDKIDKLLANNDFEACFKYTTTFFDNIDCYSPIFNQEDKKQGIFLDIFKEVVINSNIVVHKEVVTLISSIVSNLNIALNELNENDNFSKTYDKYKDNISLSLKENEHFIENIFVNAFFSLVYPFNQVYSVKEILIIFTLNYALYKGFLTFYFGDKKDKIEKDELIKITVLFSRLYLFQNISVLLQEFKAQKLDSLAHLINLIKNS